MTARQRLRVAALVVVAAAAVLSWVLWTGAREELEPEGAREVRQPGDVSSGFPIDASGRRDRKALTLEDVGQEAQASGEARRMERGSLEVRVVDRDGTGVAGCWVSAVPRHLMGSWQTKESRTDHEGLVKFTDLEMGWWRAYLIEEDAELVEITPGRPARLRLAVPSSRFLTSGLVVDREGTPVPHASISLSRDLDALAWREVARTDMNGNFQFAAADEVGAVCAQARAFLRSDPLLLEGAPRRGLVFQLVPGGVSLNGWVHSPEGTVAHEAVVSVRDATRRCHVSRPNDEGHFSLDGLPTGKTVVAATSPGAELWTRTLELESDETEPLHIQLTAGLSLRGRVVRSDGSAGRAYVSSESEHEHLTTLVRTDEFGEFLLSGLSPGLNHIRAVESDSSFTSQPVILPLQSGDQVTLMLGQHGGISGRLVDSEGVGVEGWLVTLDGTSRSGWTDGAGRFSFGGLERKAYDLSVHSRRGMPAIETYSGRFPSAREYELEVDRDAAEPVTLTGRVVDSFGKPVLGVRVSVQKHSFTGFHPSFHASTDSKGRFRFRSLTQGRYEVTLEYSGYPLQVWGNARVTESTDLGELHLEQGALLRLRLISEHAQAAGRQLYFFWASDRPELIELVGERTDVEIEVTPGVHLLRWSWVEADIKRLAGHLEIKLGEVAYREIDLDVD